MESFLKIPLILNNYKQCLPAGYEVRKDGIITLECGFLAASLDGIVTSTDDNETGVIEIMC